MAIARENKKLLYKVAQGSAKNETLQSMLTKALRKFPTPDSRLDRLGTDGSDVRFINLNRKHRGITLGVFHKVTEGAAQHVIDMGAKGEEWLVSQVTAKTADRPKGEFVEGTLFYAIFKDHVVLHQSMSCRSDHFEQYINWLLRRYADETSPGVFPDLIALNDPLPRSVAEKQNIPVQNIKIASAMEATASPPGGTVKSGSFRFKPTGGVWEGIMRILESQGIKIPKDLTMDDPLGGDDVRVHLELSCTKKASQSSAGEVLTKLGHALRHHDADFYTLRLVDGTKITGDMIKIEGVVRVECADRLPIPESMFKCMVEYFEELAENQTLGEIEPFGNTK